MPDAAKAVTGTWIAGDQKVRDQRRASWPATEIEAAAKMDLASLGRLLSPEEQAWSGQLDALVRARPDRDLWNLGLRLDFHDPGQITKGAARFKIDGDVTLGVKATYAPGADRLELTEMGLKAPFVQLDGAGSMSARDGFAGARPERNARCRLAGDRRATGQEGRARRADHRQFAAVAALRKDPSDPFALDRLGSLRRRNWRPDRLARPLRHAAEPRRRSCCASPTGG